MRRKILIKPRCSQLHKILRSRSSLQNSKYIFTYRIVFRLDFRDGQRTKKTDIVRADTSSCISVDAMHCDMSIVELKITGQ